MEDSTRYKVRSFLVYLNLFFLLQALKLDGDIIQVGEGVQSEEIVFKWVNQWKAMISDGLFLLRDGSRFYGNWNHDSGSAEGRGQVGFMRTFCVYPTS